MASLGVKHTKVEKVRMRIVMAPSLLDLVLLEAMERESRRFPAVIQEVMVMGITGMYMVTISMMVK